MAAHGSATAREETPHVKQTSRTNTIINVLRRRAESVLNDTSIDPQTRAIIRHALEINDPWLAKLVRRIDAGETSIDTIDDAREKIEALAEMICRGGNEPAAALFVLMARLQNAADPKTLANTAKHHAFTRCGELNVYGMVDAQIASLEAELLAVSSGL